MTATILPLLRRLRHSNAVPISPLELHTWCGVHSDVPGDDVGFLADKKAAGDVPYGSYLVPLLPHFRYDEAPQNNSRRDHTWQIFHSG
jgi:hypothetical protein